MWEAMEAKRSGMKSGVPDLCFPVPMQGFGGLYVEMKRKEGGLLAPMQKYWLAFLEYYNYKAVVCNGADAALPVIDAYFKGFVGVPQALTHMLAVIMEKQKAHFAEKRARKAAFKAACQAKGTKT